MRSEVSRYEIVWGEIMPIIYQPPLIVSASRIGDRFSEPREEPLERYARGKFVVCARDDTVTLYGLLWAQADADVFKLDYVSHADVTSYLGRMEKHVEGFELGGGFLRFDHAQKLMQVGGESGRLGNVPKFIIEGCLAAFPNYTAAVSGEDAANPLRRILAEQWYQERGIEIRTT